MKLIIPFVTCLILIGACKNDKKNSLLDGIDASMDAKEFRKGTLRMIDSLNAIYARTDFNGHPYAKEEFIHLLEQRIANNPQANIQEKLLYAYQLLQGGQIDKSIATFEELYRLVPSLKEVTQENKTIQELLAVAFLRKGEVENCILNHSEESCLFPIQGKGIHVKPDGSRKAIEIYTRILTKFPDDLQSRYLLNLAYMTLGEYPGGVPKQWLIPASAFQSGYNLPKFPNIAMKLGVDVNGLSGGTITDDFDNDGLIDIMASSWGLKDQVRFFKNNGDGTFTDRTEAAGLKGETGGLYIVQADYNNDGNLDFLIVRGAWYMKKAWGIQPNSLMKNNGDGTFSDATFEAGLYTVTPTQSVAWLDFNMDGNLDLFVGNESAIGGEVFPCDFFVNKGDGTFVNKAQQFGLNIAGWVKGVSSADINNDGLPDIYISRLDGYNKLFVNRGGKDIDDWKFEEISGKAKVGEPWSSFPCWFFDYNNDGLEDLFVSSFDSLAFGMQAHEVAADMLGLPFKTDTPRLYLNKGNETFVNVTKTVDLNHPLHTMGCNYGDLDNDGYLDFYLATGAPDYRSIVPNRMFRNDSGRTFQDVTTTGGFGHIQKGHAVGFADFDNDGDQDVYVVMGGSVSGDNFQNALFENPGNNNNWITLQLTGTKSNRSAIGARIRIMVKQANGQQRTIYATVNSGASFGANSLQQEIGLGDASEIISVEVIWPNGKNQFVNYGSLEPKRRYKLVEGQQPKAEELTSFAMKGDGGSIRHHRH